MFQIVSAFSKGIGFHKKGIRFGFRNPSFLLLSLLPFAFTLLLYVFGFYLFSAHADDWLQRLWHVDTTQSSAVVGWLYWLYMHVVKFILYGLLLVVMFYTFIVMANVVASPIYDHISGKYERITLTSGENLPQDGHGTNILRIIFEELKKAVFAVLIPIILLFIPVIGPVLAFITAAVFMAWDYVDYSLSRETPLFKARLKTVWRHKFLFLGYGCPLVIPFLGLLVLPFAILGATILYHDIIKERAA